MFEMAAPPLNLGEDEQIAPSHLSGFSKCLEFEREFFNEMGVMPIAYIHSVSPKWGYVLRGIFPQQTEIPGRMTRGSLICWSGPGRDDVQFMIDDASPEPDLPERA